MPLLLQSQVTEHVVIIRCQGRIVSGDEVRALQVEVEKPKHSTKRIVLHLEEVTHIDSAGLGALVRLFSVLRTDGGGLKLCQLSPFVLKALHVTNLHAVIPTYASEKEAVEAFSLRMEPPERASLTHNGTIVCIDSSGDLLAYLNALLMRAGYEVFTTKYLEDARKLVSAIKPQVVIYGPGSQSSESMMEKIRQSFPNVHALLLPLDFSTADASHAGTELVNRLKSVLAAQASD